MLAFACLCATAYESVHASGRKTCASFVCRLASAGKVAGAVNEAPFYGDFTGNFHVIFGDVLRRTMTALYYNNAPAVLREVRGHTYRDAFIAH